MRRRKNGVWKLHYKTFFTKSLIGSYRQKLLYDSYYIRALEPFQISKDQLKNSVAILIKVIKAENRRNLALSLNFIPIRLKVNVYPYFTLTMKSKESRMGKGKGSIQSYYFPIKRGLILFELLNITRKTAVICFDRLKYKVGSLLRLESVFF